MIITGDQFDIITIFTTTKKKGATPFLVPAYILLNFTKKNMGTPPYPP